MWKDFNLIMSKLRLDFWLDMMGYLSVVLSFLVFIYLNGGIVVGDRSSHETIIHIPQLFYFSLFCMVFSWPHFVGELLNFISFAKRHQLVVVLAMLIALLIVHFNTLVHPYLLADNRHYVFYIWNRFYGKFIWFRYIMVPFYVFAWYVILKVMYNRHDISLVLTYVPCTMIILATQKLLDFRYFFVPYVLFRLRIRNSQTTVFNLILEFVTFTITNCITFNLFFQKPIMWSDYAFPQRMIW